MKRVWLALILCLTIGLGSNAQVISGNFKNTDSEEPLQGVAIVLRSMPDSTYIGGTVSDSTGHFKFSNLKQGTYRLSYSLIGFLPGTFTFKMTNKPLLTSDIGMDPTDISLGEAGITAAAAPVTVKEDTVFYNASAYHVPEGSNLEKLIEQLPGAEITEDGAIKINGIEYKHILVDGKEFFSDDPKTAIKNLPANFVKRLRTYNRKSEQARLTGVDDGEEDNVIDLEIKKGMKKGWNGTATAALGSEKRYQEQANLGYFRDNSLASFVGNVGNIDERNSSRSLTANKQIGLTMSNELRNHYKWSGNVRYNYDDRDASDHSHAETQFTDSTGQTRDSRNSSRNGGGNFHSDFRWEWHPDTLTTLVVNPSVTISSSNNAGQSLSTTDSWTTADTLALNRHFSDSYSDGNSFDAGLSLRVVRRLNKRGRNLSVNTSYNYHRNTSDSYSMSEITYFQQASKNQHYNRYTDNERLNQQFNVGLTYSEPLFKSSFLQFSYSFSYRYAHSNQYGYRQDFNDSTSQEIDWAALPPDTALSSCNASRYLVHQLGLNIKHVTKVMQLSYGVTLHPQSQTTRHLFGPNSYKGTQRQHLLNWAPAFNFNYRFSRREQLRISYNGQSREPDIDQMQEVISKVNPQNIRYGNPGLKPSFTHNVNLRYNRSEELSGRSYTANASFTNTTNSTSNLTLYDASTGTRISKIMNVDGTWNTNGNLGLNIPLDKAKHLTASSNTALGAGGSTNYNTTPLTATDLTNAGISNSFENMTPQDVDRLAGIGRKNQTHSFSIREQLGIAYRSKTFHSNLRGSVAYEKISNSLQKSSGRETTDYRMDANASWELPWDMEVSSDCHFTCRLGYKGGGLKNEWLWNVEASKNFLNRKAATLRIRFYDLLHERSTLTRRVNNLTVTDSEYEALSSYFLVSFIYKINTFGRGKASKSFRRSRDD